MSVRFSREELKSLTGKKLPDLISHDVRLLFVGINPGLRSVAVQAPFAPRGNRFYPALFRAGITDRIIDASAGFADVDRDYLLHRGIGITGLVERATAGAAELTVDEFVQGERRLRKVVAKYSPKVVAFLGITAYRAALNDPKAVLGKQPAPYLSSELWVLPNPSGRNAHASLDGLAASYGEAARAAGIFVGGRPKHPAHQP